MTGFQLHQLLPSLKVRVSAIHQHGDRLYVGTATGSIQVYSFEIPNESGSSIVPILKLLKTYAIGKRPIDQIGVLSESQKLAVLCDSVVTTHTLPDFAKTGAAVLLQARYAHSFAITSFTASPKKKAKDAQAGEDVSVEKVRRDLLVVGCRKKVVVFGAGKGGMKDAWELNLPHSPRQVIFASTPSSSSSAPLPETLHLLYSPTSSVLLHIHPNSANRLSVTDLPLTPPPPVHSSNARLTDVSSGSGVAAGEGGSSGSGLTKGVGGMMTGLGGYVGLGGKATMPVGTRTVGGEVLLARDDVGVFYSSEGNFTRQESLQWPNSPEAIAFTNPFIYSAVPQTSGNPVDSGSNIVNTAIQIHLAPTLGLRQTLFLPAPSTGSISISAIDCIDSVNLTPASAMAASSKVLFVSTPNDKNLAQSEGSSVWAVEAGDIGEQVDELVKEGRVQDAIGLVEAMGDAGLSPTRRLAHLQKLLAVQQFGQGQYQTAMDTFLRLNINPALIISLFPAATIAGRTHVSRSQWMELFGAIPGSRLEPDQAARTEAPSKGLLSNLAPRVLNKKGSVETLRHAPGKEDDAASLASDKEPAAPLVDDSVAPRQALEALMYYLSDRRQKLTGAIGSLADPLPLESSVPPLSTLSATELHDLPSMPFPEMSPDQLLRMAQVIYTALIKVYLVARPVLVGSLCRIENWCDVEEVEELLKAQKKFSDLIDLYQGKKMHSKALKMLHQLAKEEDDKLDRYPPTIRYLQKLGPTELPLILESSKWVFEENPSMALSIFTADEPEVEALPRKEVTSFLEKQDLDACAGYLEHIIKELGETGAEFHDKLAEIYLSRAVTGFSKAKKEEVPESYTSFLKFLMESTHYRPYRLITKVDENKMPEARAILLGRIGKHEEALRIYVHRLKDCPAAEAYCARVYAQEPDPKGIFLILLRIYLRPTPKSDEPVLLDAALALIATHGVRVDATEMLDLLPPLVPMADVRAFFIRTMRDGFARKNDAKIIKSVVSARKEEVDRVLMGLQVKRVRVTDQRICPQCQKRLGQSAVAVHAPRGEVTHLHCKDTFSAKLAQLRE